jgi:hypothetical protein
MFNLLAAHGFSEVTQAVLPVYKWSIECVQCYRAADRCIALSAIKIVNVLFNEAVDCQV